MFFAQRCDLLSDGGNRGRNREGCQGRDSVSAALGLCMLEDWQTVTLGETGAEVPGIS
jgi:hypothetical protein